MSDVVMVEVGGQTYDVRYSIDPGDGPLEYHYYHGHVGTAPSFRVEEVELDGVWLKIDDPEVVDVKQEFNDALRAVFEEDARWY
jgi:hypothetical protein